MIEHNLFEMENYRELIDEVGVDKFRVQHTDRYLHVYY